jgi:hypothetical protein
MENGWQRLSLRGSRIEKDEKDEKDEEEFLCHRASV